MRIHSHYLLTTVASVLALSACSSVPELPDVASMLHPYRIDVRQGNFVTQDMVAKLKPGQTKDQVRFILGSPLIEDAFHAQRWDYVYRFKPGNGEATERHFTVYFDNDKLARVGGDVIANSAEAEAADQRTAPQRARVIEIAGPAGGVPVADAAKPAEKPWWKFYE